MNLTSLNHVLKTISRLKWWIIVLIFIGFLSYLFADEIKTYILPDDQVGRNIDKAKLVNSVLRQMMNEYNGDRSYVWRFHNGVNYYDGSHKVRSSMDYEVVANGIAPIGLFMQDVPTSLFADQMAAIINGEIMGQPLDDVKDKAASSVMAEFGITHSAALPYYDDKGRILMVIGIDWVNKNKIALLEDRFRKYVDKVGRMITNKPSDDIIDLLSRDTHVIRSLDQEMPQFVLDFEERQRQAPIITGISAPCFESKKTKLLAIIDNAR